MEGNLLQTVLFVGGIYYLFFHESGKEVTKAVVTAAKETTTK